VEAIEILAQPLDNALAEILELPSRPPLVVSFLEAFFHEVCQPGREPLTRRPGNSFKHALPCPTCGSMVWRLSRVPDKALEEELGTATDELKKN
jgi:hypothetical protein